MQKILDYWAPLCSLQGIKIHFCEFLYDFALKRNKLLGNGEDVGIRRKTNAVALAGGPLSGRPPEAIVTLWK
jgi:hypothetical protein